MLQNNWNIGKILKYLQNYENVQNTQMSKIPQNFANDQHTLKPQKWKITPKTFKWPKDSKKDWNAVNFGMLLGLAIELKISYLELVSYMFIQNFYTIWFEYLIIYTNDEFSFWYI